MHRQRCGLEFLEPGFEPTLMEYAVARRLKLWGRARVVAGDPDLLARLAAPGYPVRIEQAIVFSVSAWDWNCSQHIPHLVPANARP